MQEKSLLGGRMHEQLAAQAQLGSYVTVYKPRTVFIVMMSAIAVIVGVCLFALDIALSQPATSYQQSTCFATVGGVLALGGLVWMYFGLKNRKLRVFIYTHGLVSVDQRPKVLRWDQVQQVWRKWREKEAPSPSNSQSSTTAQAPKKATVINKCVVQLKDGNLIEIVDYIPGLSQVTKTIEQESMRYLFPQLMSCFASGNTISFGLLSISRAGMSNGEQTLPWHELQAVRVEEGGMISIQRGGAWQEWYKSALEDTPNIAVFEAIANALVGR